MGEPPSIVATVGGGSFYECRSPGSTLDTEHIIKACRTPAAPVKHGKEQAPFSCGPLGITDVLDPGAES